jgi:hypothetical protein
MEIAKLPQEINLESGFVAIAIIACALALIGWINRKRFAAWARDWQLQRCLNSIGSEQIRDLVCPDGLEGHYQLDRLALTNDAVVLIIYKAFGGNIFCAERISEWTQVVGQKSYKFDNPLFELENQLTALRLMMGDIPLRGYLIFNRYARFPKGHPDRILHQDTIPENLLATHCGNPGPEVMAAWQKLKRLPREAPSDAGLGVKT